MNAARRVTRVSLALAGVLVGVLVLACASALAAPPEAPGPVVVESIKATGATLRGTLNPGKTGEPGTYETGTYEFLYKQSKTECEGGIATTPGMSLGGGKEELPAETLSGLKQGSEYTVCLRVKTAGGTTVGPKVTFTTAIPPETPETGTPNPIAATSATFKGVLNPKNEGNAGSYEFLYRVSSSECQGENATPTTSAHGTKEEAVSVPVAGLQPGVQYTVCLLARNTAQETSLGAPVTFSTPGAPPAVEGESVSEGTPTSYTLQATINSDNQQTTYYFEYGTKATGETLEGTITKINGGTLHGEYGGQAVSVHTGALTPGTTYYYRVAASNGTPPPTSGKVERFATPEAPVTESATAQGSSAALLAGELNPSGASGKITYWFDYNDNGTCSGGQSTPAVEVAEGKQLHVQAEAQELEANAQYTFCLVATNAYGGQAVGNAVFALTARHEPKLAQVSVTDVTSGEAKVSALIYAYSEPTSYHVEYGTTGNYGSSTPEVSVPASLGPVALQVDLTDLDSGTLYHFRILASNAVGTERTTDATFTTGSSSVGGTRMLPGGRTDVMVSPLENHDAEADAPYLTGNLEEGIQQKDGVFQVAEDGNAVAYMSQPTVGGGGNEAELFGGDQQLATKNVTGGWTQMTAEPEGRLGSAFQGHELEVQAFSPDFTFDIFATNCGTCGLPGVLPNPDLSLTVRAPGGPGRGYVRLGLENWGCRRPFSRAQEVHFEGDA